jgi:hypothetical protein
MAKKLFAGAASGAVWTYTRRHMLCYGLKAVFYTTIVTWLVTWGFTL